MRRLPETNFVINSIRSGPVREPRELAVWTEMSRALMLLKEFIYVR